MSLLAKISRHNGRFLAFTKPRTCVVATKTTGTAQEQIDEYVAKNKKLNRPTSPHLTIYNMHEVTSLLSVTHRATGIVLTAAVSGFAFATPFLSQNFDQVIMSLQSWNETWMGYLLLMDLKFLLVFPLVFHTLNGLRHLRWDLGQGLEINDVRKTGYAIMALSVLISSAIVYLLK